MDHRLAVTRAHTLEYRMPLKRPYGTSRGITRASTSFLLLLYGHVGDRELSGVGEAQARRRLTGDLNTDAAWKFFNIAAKTLPGRSIDIESVSTARRGAKDLMQELEEIAEQESQPLNNLKPFRGSLLGLEVAILDLVSQALNVTLAELLGPVKRTSVPVTVRTLSTHSNKERVERKVKDQATQFPMVRVKGQGTLDKDLALLQSIHRVNHSAGVKEKPIWMDLNEGYEPSEAKRFIRHVASLIREDELPRLLTLEQPVRAGEELPALQRYADREVAKSGKGEIRIMIDETLWDVDDFSEISELGGCRAINIKTAKAGGLMRSLELANFAVEKDPDVNICIGGMVGTSDVSTWSLLNLAKVLPKIDYLTAVPPANVVERITEPLTQLGRGNNLHILPDSYSGLGGKLAYEKVLPFIRRHAWYPHSRPATRHIENSYSVSPYLGFTKTELDNHLLEAEALKFGLQTMRMDGLTFTASDDNRSIGFQWTRASSSSRAAVSITSDKHSSRLMLQEAGVPVPRGGRFSYSDREGAAEFAEEVGFPVVFKPLRGTGGRGVVTDISTIEDLDWAFTSLRGTSYEGREIIVEEQIDGTSARLFVVGDDVLSMILYHHGEVVGDGTMTVGELLLQKVSMRKRNPHLMNRPLRFSSSMTRLLEKQGVSYGTVLRAGQKIRYTLNPNPQQGGETFDAIAELHPSFVDASVHAAQTIPGLTFTALDWIIPDHKAPLAAQRAAICEVNAHPSQSGNQFPLYGTSSNISHSIVQEVAARQGLELKHTGSKSMGIQSQVSGYRIGERYFSRFIREARRLGASGFLDPLTSSQVVINLWGPVEAVTSLASYAVKGLSDTVIHSVLSIPSSRKLTGEFKDIP